MVQEAFVNAIKQEERPFEKRETKEMLQERIATKFDVLKILESHWDAKAFWYDDLWQHSDLAVQPTRTRVENESKPFGTCDERDQKIGEAFQKDSDDIVEAASILYKSM